MWLHVCSLVDYHFPFMRPFNYQFRRYRIEFSGHRSDIITTVLSSNVYTFSVTDISLVNNIKYRRGPSTTLPYGHTPTSVFCVTMIVYRLSQTGNTVHPDLTQYYNIEQAGYFLLRKVAPNARTRSNVWWIFKNAAEQYFFFFFKGSFNFFFKHSINLLHYRVLGSKNRICDGGLFHLYRDYLLYLLENIFYTKWKYREFF